MDEDNNWSLCLGIEVTGEDIEVKAIFAALEFTPWRILRAGRWQGCGLADTFPAQGRCWRTEAQRHDWRCSIGNTKELEVCRPTTGMAL